MMCSFELLHVEEAQREKQRAGVIKLYTVSCTVKIGRLKIPLFPMGYVISTSLKIRYRKVCWFESDLGHQTFNNPYFL